MIINAEFTAGGTIDEAIGEALDFASRNHCMVRADINEVKGMLFFDSSLLGNTREEKIKKFHEEYDFRRKEQEK